MGACRAEVPCDQPPIKTLGEELPDGHLAGAVTLLSSMFCGTPLGQALNPAPGVPNLCLHACPVLTVHCILPLSCLNCESSKSQAWVVSGTPAPSHVGAGHRAGAAALHRGKRTPLGQGPRAGHSRRRRRARLGKGGQPLLWGGLRTIPAHRGQQKSQL